MDLGDAALVDSGSYIRHSLDLSSSVFGLSALRSSLSRASSFLGSEIYRSGDLYVQSLSCNHNHAKSTDDHVSYLRLYTDSRRTSLELATTPSKWRHSKALRRMSKRCLLCSIIAHGMIAYLELLSIENRQLLCQRSIGVLKFVYSAEAAVLFTVPVSTTHAVSFGLFSTQDRLPIRKLTLMPPVLDLTYVVSAVTHWISECELTHPDCDVHKNPVLPTRVLDVGDSNIDDSVKLIMGHDLTAQYITLSYCSENPNTMIKTTTLSLPNYEQGIPWLSFPKTFQDAILLTRAFGIRYLWIDTLCVLQDNVENGEREAANMARIYSDSFLTLAATAGSDPSMGLFVERWTRCGLGSSLPHSCRKEVWRDKKVSIEGKKVPVDHQDGVYIRPKLYLAHERLRAEYNADGFLEDAPLLSQGWALQERLLSPRTLHFHAEELVWECKSGLRCECNELQYNGTTDVVMPQGLKQSLTLALKADASVETMGHVWLRIVSAYTRLYLAKESDRLPALSDLASSLSKMALGSYLAGLWSKDLARGLLFEVAKPAKQKTDQAHCPPPTAVQPSQPKTAFPHLDSIIEGTSTNPRRLSPTWSWSSIPLQSSTYISYGSVLRNRVRQDADFKIINSQCTPLGRNTFSWVATSVLKVKGRIVEGVVQPSPPSPRNTLRLTRKSQTSFRSAVCLAGFRNDGRISFKGGEVLTCLLVGRSSSPDHKEKIFRDYALVIQQVCAKRRQYRRVGLLVIGFSDQWFSESEVESLELI